jgi:hypothetical protein
MWQIHTSSPNAECPEALKDYVFRNTKDLLVPAGKELYITSAS